MINLDLNHKVLNTWLKRNDGLSIVADIIIRSEIEFGNKEIAFDCIDYQSRQSPDIKDIEKENDIDFRCFHKMLFMLEKEKSILDQISTLIESDILPKLSKLKTRGSERVIALTEENIKTFKKYRAWLSEMILPQSDTPFIPKLDGSHLNKNFGRTTMTILTREAELPYYAPHGLRHTHATNLANTEIPMKLLSARLGHSTVTTTMDRYSKPKIEESVKYLELVQKN
jgi:integrase